MYLRVSFASHHHVSSLSVGCSRHIIISHLQVEAIVDRVTRVSDGLLVLESTVERTMAPTLDLTARIADSVIDTVLPEHHVPTYVTYLL